MSSTNTTTTEPPLDYSNSGPGVAIAMSIIGFVATIIVGLRFWARKLTRQSYGLDDWLCLAALITQHALLAASCVCIVDGGLGRDMRITAVEDPNSVVVLFQALLAAEIAYTYSSPLIKLSVLAFYWRLFPTARVQLGCKIIGSMCIAWSLAITILNFVQCRPLKAFWYTELQALPTTHCLDSILCFLGNSIANCIIDFMTLTLPIQEVVKLRTTRKRKIHICCVFLLGGIAFAASMVRTVSTGIMYRNGVTNFTKQFIVSGAATVIEIYAAIAGACLPTLMPVYRKLRYGDPMISQTSGISKQSLGSKAKGSRRKDENGSFERLSNGKSTLVPSAHHQDHFVDITSSHPSEDITYMDDIEGYPMQGVRVTHDMVWSEDRQGPNAV